MDIRYHGSQSIAIKSKNLEVLIGVDSTSIAKVSQRLLIADPRGEIIDFGSVPEGKVLINGAGEYEIGGVDVKGIRYTDNKLFYSLIIDDYKVGVIFEDGKIENISEKVDLVDVLVVLNPLEGVEDRLVALTKKLGNNFLILVGSKESHKGILDAVDREDIVPVDKFSLKSGQEMSEGMEVVLLDK